MHATIRESLRYLNKKIGECIDELPKDLTAEEREKFVGKINELMGGTKYLVGALYKRGFSLEQGLERIEEKYARSEDYRFLINYV